MKIRYVRAGFSDKLNLHYSSTVPSVELLAELEPGDNYEDVLLDLQQKACIAWTEGAIVRVKEHMAIRTSNGDDLENLPQLLDFLIARIS